jgi:type VI secretion system protein ImpE
MGMTADGLLKAGQVEEARQALVAQVRRDPGDARARVFLFQLLAVLGQWRRAGEQLVASRELDPSNVLLAQTYGVLARAEIDRAAVFARKHLPTVVGEPAAWLAQLLQALKLSLDGEAEAAAKLRTQALEEAPATAGRIDDVPFEWIADADMRFGPCLEAVINTGYVWVPMAQLKEIRFEAPSDLRDMVWLPVELVWRHGGKTVGFVPVRYPGSECSEEGELLLARRTEWQDIGGGEYAGLGQRMFATDAGEYPLLDTRLITFE